MCVTTIFSRPKLVRQSIFHGTTVNLAEPRAQDGAQTAFCDVAAGASAKKPSRGAVSYTLRFLKFADGDPTVVGTPQRAPAFDVIFFSLLDKFEVDDDVWLENDALALCTLAMLHALFHQVHVHRMRRRRSPMKTMRWIATTLASRAYEQPRSRSGRPQVAPTQARQNRGRCGEHVRLRRQPQCRNRLDSANLA